MNFIFIVKNIILSKRFFQININIQENSLRYAI